MDVDGEEVNHVLNLLSIHPGGAKCQNVWVETHTNKDRNSALNFDILGFPMVKAQSRQYNIGEKLTVIPVHLTLNAMHVHQMGF